MYFHTQEIMGSPRNLQLKTKSICQHGLTSCAVTTNMSAWLNELCSHYSTYDMTQHVNVLLPEDALPPLLLMLLPCELLPFGSIRNDLFLLLLLVLPPEATAPTNDQIKKKTMLRNSNLATVDRKQSSYSG